MGPHRISRVRHEPRRRTLRVEAIEDLAPKMRRILFSSPDLADFVSASADDHIKLFFPSTGPDEPSAMRDFTPRRFDTAQGQMVIDFALHDAGPATAWARSATVGDPLEIGGPRGSAVVPDDFDWYLLIGDETALPAIGRRIEELRVGVPVTSVVVVDSVEGGQAFITRAAWSPLWVAREGRRDDAAALQAALAQVDLPQGDGFVWIAAEAGVARAVRSYMVEKRGHRPEWLKAAGYWKQGEADAHERIEG